MAPLLWPWDQKAVNDLEKGIISDPEEIQGGSIHR